MAASFRDKAPYVMHDPEKCDLFVIPGMKATSVPVGLTAAAGKKAEELGKRSARVSRIFIPAAGIPRPGWQIKNAMGSAARSSTRRSALVICNHLTTTTRAPAF
jgi:hypothetical protein